MRVSLQHIADELHLSRATVSWVLNGKGDEHNISEATQKKVLECAKKLNYRPNLLARSLNTGITNILGLIIPDITDSFYASIAKAVESCAEKRGYSLMIASSESDVERENRLIQLFTAKQVDGIIIAPTKNSRIEIQKLVDERYPLVLFDRYFPDMQSNYIIIDNEEAAYNVVSRMIQNGAKKIAILTTNPHLLTLNLRCEGYRRALREHGLDIFPSLYKEIAFDNYEYCVATALDEIYKSDPDVDGFFFTTHILALVAFRYFYENGIDFNKGLQLGSIHGLDVFKALAPGMHIAWMPVDEIGEKAVDIIFSEIDRRKSRQPENNSPEKLILKCR